MLITETLQNSFPKFLPPFRLIMEIREMASKNHFNISLPIAGEIRQEKKGERKGANSVRETVPWRMIFGRTPETSNTVLPNPPAVFPPSRMASTRFPRAWETSLAREALGCPVTFALVAVIARPTAWTKA